MVFISFAFARRVPVTHFFTYYGFISKAVKNIIESFCLKIYVIREKLSFTIQRSILSVASLKPMIRRCSFDVFGHTAQTKPHGEKSSINTYFIFVYSNANHKVAKFFIQ